MITMAVTMMTHHSLHSVIMFMILSGLTSSVTAISIPSINATDVSSTTVTFTWDFDGIDVETVNVTDDRRSYIRLRSGFNFDIATSCLPLNTTTRTFNNIQPFTSYSACISIVRINDNDDCDEDSTVVTQMPKEKCEAVTTDFEQWSRYNIAAVGCAGGIVLIAVFAVLINVVCPEKKPNDVNKVNKEKMRAWSKKKRTESVRDFLESVKVDDDDDQYPDTNILYVKKGGYK